MQEKDFFYQDLIPKTNLQTFLTKKNISLDDIVQQTPWNKYALVKMEQTHAANSFFVKKRVAQLVPNVDAVYTDQKEVLLTIKTADCLPVFIYHPYPMIAAIHAGREGTQKNILAKTLQAIMRDFQIKDNFTIWFGPAICNNCYQIDPVQDLYYNLKEENKKQINEVIDLKTSKIIDFPFCTSCRNDLFYSYRKEKTDKRIWSGIVMN
ncbi:polyphenol oxidase family protein [bacterium]|jgi:polyphenol oxidase|nr:polyphenol oxidase family protein [bacterium]MBT3581058.1 polyphenol oxidase family protein [bacterium]MBT4552525.1 polyphenol oxidase family protein [bacterium]MBT7088364.1 polyphenol oxidase family protein [bacterium]